MIQNGVAVSHILSAIENSQADIFAIDLGWSLNTPYPIESKQELVNALELDENDMDKDIEFK